MESGDRIFTHPPTKSPPPPRKRSRPSRRTPTTVLATDTTNFRDMVQIFTGIPCFPPSPPPFLHPNFPQFAAPSSPPFFDPLSPNFHQFDHSIGFLDDFFASKEAEDGRRGKRRSEIDDCKLDSWFSSKDCKDC